MNTFLFIKIIAFITMVIDHIGCINPSNNIVILRIIGRISFPLFCLLMAYGSKVSKHPLKKIIKLTIISIIAIPCYIYYFESTKPNFFITYLIFNLFVLFIKKFKLENTFSEYILITLLGLFVWEFDFVYSWYGIALCYLFYKVSNKYKACIYFIILNYLYGFIKSGFILSWSTQSYAILAVPFIYLFYNNLEKNKIGTRKIYDSKFKNFLSQNLFYILYPLHIIILYLLRLWII